MEWEHAKEACNNLTYAGYSDWFLPNEEELLMMAKNKNAIGGWDSSDGWFWSSTSNGAYNAWVVNIIGERSYSHSRDNFNYARCVRKEN